MQDFTATLHMWHFLLPGDGIKRDPERENCAVLTIAAQTANSIHIRVTFNAVTRYCALSSSGIAKIVMAPATLP